MTENQHTPGPWHMYRAGDDSWYPGIAAGKRDIVLWGDAEDEEDDGGVRGATPEERRANARLIAAAPALLDALVALCDCQSLDFDGSPSIRAAVERARTVIAKLGEEPRP